MAWNVWSHVFRVAVKVPWKCHESAMKVPWVWYEYDKNMIQWIWTIFHGRFMALSFKNSKIVQIHHIIFISDSCRFHATFMALSWRFHGSPKNLARNTFIPFSWRFLWKLVQNSHISYLCLSVCRLSMCFFLLLIFSLMVFQVDQSFLFLIKGFLLFSLIKI